MTIQKIKYLAFFIVLFSTVDVLSQFSNEGEPISWALEYDVEHYSDVYEVPKPNLEELYIEDLLKDEMESNPYRFAVDIDVDFSMTNSGAWVTLDNGDKIWSMTVFSEDAMGLGLSFDGFNVPEGAKLYIYNETHEKVIGPFTSEENNKLNILTILPISNDKIIIEYYLPYGAENDGLVELKSVNYQYREFESDVLSNCMVNARCISSDENESQLNSVLKIITDDGKEVGTGVFINSIGRKDDVYVITSSKMNQGSPLNWYFVFNNYSKSCFDTGISKDNTICIGAEIIEVSENSGLILLKLNEKPKHNWKIFYSGWDRIINSHSEGYSLNYAYGSVCSIANCDTEFDFDIDDNQWIVNSWNNGVMGPGSLGAPLFDSNGLVIGFYNGGNIGCDITQFGEDRVDTFIPFSLAWNDFKDFLDFENTDQNYISGEKPIILRDPDIKWEEIEELSLFPNPAVGFINLINNDGLTLNSVEVYNVQGQLILYKELSDDIQQRISLSSLDLGWYLFVVRSNDKIIRHSVLVK